MDYKYLKNARNLKAFFRDASSSELESIIEKLTSLRDCVKSEEIRRETELKEKTAFLSNLLNDLDAHNFTVSDLAALTGVKKEPRKKLDARYRYVGTDGETYLWSGQGKIPKKMREVMLRDGITDKNFYRIKKD